MQDNRGREKFSRTLIVFTLQQLPLISSQMWEELRGIDTLDSFSLCERRLLWCVVSFTDVS